MRERLSEEFSAMPFIQRLVGAGSNLGQQLADSMYTSLRAYLRGLIPATPAGPPNPNLLLLACAMERYLSAQGEHEVAEVCDALLCTPVIQQADHSNLLLDTETFLNNLLFHTASREAGVRVAISSQCSTVACLSRRVPVGGPVFLWTRGGCYQLFDFSKRQLHNSSFCALPMPTTLTIRPITGMAPSVQHDPVLARIAGRTVTNAADTFRIANAEFWDSLDVDHGIRRVSVDERMASEAIALHIEQGEGPIFRLLFDPSVRDAFVRTKRRLVESPLNIAVNRAEPDFLWYRKGSQLRTVVLEGAGAHARLVVDTAPLPVPYEPRAVVAALRRGDLYGDRILAYMVRCLLPGVVAVGGTVQQDYVDLYRQITLETHGEQPFLSDDEVKNLNRRDLTRLGGAPLLELDSSAASILQWLGPDTRLRDFESGVLEVQVGCSIGRMGCAWFYERLLERQAKRKELA